MFHFTTMLYLFLHYNNQQLHGKTVTKKTTEYFKCYSNEAHNPTEWQFIEQQYNVHAAKHRQP